MIVEKKLQEGFGMCVVLEKEDEIVFGFLYNVNSPHADSQSISQSIDDVKGQMAGI
jgi:hypothetical protein